MVRRRALKALWASCAAVLAGLCLLAAGCSQWGKSNEPTEFRFPRNQMAPNSVAFELAVAQIPADRVGELESVWGELDHQEIDLSIRQRLDQNGLRAAVIPARIPAELETLLRPVALAPEGLDKWQQELERQGLLESAHPLVFHTRAQRRAGEPYLVATSGAWPEQSWVVRIDGQQTPGVGENVQGVWEIEATPRGDGSVRVKLTPVIHHGDVRPQIGVEEGNFLFQSRQTELRLDELAIQSSLLPGETLLVGATADLSDLGQLFFRPSKRIKPDDFRLIAESEIVPQGEQRFLLIRLVQTQLDDLFGWTKETEESASSR